MAVRKREFVALLIQHEVDLRAYIACMVRDLHQREDVYQDVAVSLWESFDSYRHDKPFGAWARGIARNKLLQMYRSDRRAIQVFSPEALEMVSTAFENRPHDDALSLEALQHCLEQLPDKSRRLLQLRYESGRKLKDIAHTLNQTASGVHRALARIRSLLSDCIRKQLNHASNRECGP